LLQKTTCLGERVGHAECGNEPQDQDELVAVRLELKVHGRRIQDRPDQVALRREIPGPDDDRLHRLILVLARLDDLGAALERVLLMLPARVDDVLLLDNARLGDGDALAGEHGLVHDGLAFEEDGIAEHLAAVVGHLDEVAGYEVGGHDHDGLAAGSEDVDGLAGDDGVPQVLLGRPRVVQRRGQRHPAGDLLKGHAASDLIKGHAAGDLLNGQAARYFE